MHFTLRSAVAIALTVNVAFAQPFLPSLKCLKLRDVVEGLPIADTIQTGQEALCSHNCNPTPEGLRNFYVGFLEAEAAKMGSPELKDSYVTLMDEMWKMGNERCGLLELFGGDWCKKGPSKTIATMECVQANSWRVAMSNARSILPLLSSGSCQAQVDHFSNPRYLEDFFASYLPEFLANARCDKSQ